MCGGRVAGTTAVLAVTSRLCPEAVAVGADEVALAQFVLEDGERSKAQTRDLLVLRRGIPMVVIKHRGVVERDLQSTVHAFRTV